MAAATGAPPNVESKSVKTKRGKAEGGRSSSTGTATPVVDATAQPLPSDMTTNGADGAGDSPYMKELSKCVTTLHLPALKVLTAYRSIRNVAKKLVRPSVVSYRFFM